MMKIALLASRLPESHKTNLSSQAFPRGFALFLSLFSLLNLLSRFRSARLDQNLWWIDLRWCPPMLANTFLLVATLCLLGFALHPPRSRWRRSLTIGCVGGLALICFLNAAEFYLLAARGKLHAGLL